MGCESCSFEKFKNNFINGRGEFNSPLIFVGEIPEDEDLDRKVLMNGKVGVFFNRLLKTIGISVMDCYFTVALKCRPKIWKKQPFKNDDIFSCNEILRIELLKLTKKKVIVAMGNVALRSLLKSRTAQITKYRGAPIWSNEFNCYILPTFNVGALYRNPQYTSVFLADLTKAKYLLEGKFSFSLPQCVIVRDRMLLNELLSKIEKIGVFALDLETSGFDWEKDVIGGVSICFEDNKSYYIPLVERGVNVWDNSFEILKRIGESNAKKVLANGKFDIKFFRHLGINFKNFYFDVILAHALIDENLQGMHDLKTLAGLYLNIDHYEKELDEYIKLHKECKENYLNVPVDILGKYGALDAWVTFRLFKIFLKELVKEGCLKYLLKFQIPLSNFLMMMEERGVYVDEEWSLNLKKKYNEEMEKIQNEIFKLVGKNFNLNSPKQLIEVIKTLKLKLPHKYTPTGSISTSEDSLLAIQKLNPDNMFPTLLLNYRKNFKAVTAFIDGILKLRDSEGRVHPSFMQHSIVTGRVATQEPNLQGIPRNNDIKGMFKAKDGYKIVAMDYNAAEVRVWAYCINDENLIKDFESNVDIYKMMAQRVFGIKIEDVTKEQRQQMKGVVLGLMYGRGVWSIADEFNLTIDDAQFIVDSFFQHYPNSLKWIDKTKREAKINGFVKSLFGRKRRLWGVESFDDGVREEAYRQAINFPIQSSTSDLNFLIGMRINEECLKEKLDAHPILAIHDSLLFEVKDQDVDKFVNIVKEQISRTKLGKITLVSDIVVSDRWQK
jgi:DNA polymerase-1